MTGLLRGRSDGETPRQVESRIPRARGQNCGVRRDGAIRARSRPRISHGSGTSLARTTHSMQRTEDLLDHWKPACRTSAVAGPVGVARLSQCALRHLPRTSR